LVGGLAVGQFVGPVLVFLHKKVFKFVLSASIIVIECRILGFSTEVSQKMAEQPKITNKPQGPFTDWRRTDPKPPGRAARPRFCGSAGPNKSQTDRHLETTLADNIGITESLTRREKQILRAILAGKTNKQIALMLSRSRRTVEYHRNRIMRKLDAHNTVELVKRAVALGID
jgi:DNA-binding CsgD family transcriptional regulator